MSNVGSYTLERRAAFKIGTRRNPAFRGTFIADMLFEYFESPLARHLDGIQAPGADRNLIPWAERFGLLVFHPLRGKAHYVHTFVPAPGDLVFCESGTVGIVVSQAESGTIFSAVSCDAQGDIAARAGMWGAARAFIRLTLRTAAIEDTKAA